jgi:hypothetical protein
VYPVSQFGVRGAPRGSLARVLSLVAVIVVLYGALIVAVDLRRDPGHLVGEGPLFSKLCPTLADRAFPGGGMHIECRFVPGDAHVPQRIAVGLGTLVVASMLFVGASRIQGSRPALA